MAVDDVDAVLIDQPADAQRQCGMETRFTLERNHRHPFGCELRRPVARLIQTADRGLDQISQTAAQLDYQTLGPAWRQAKDELHHTKARHDELSSQGCAIRC